MAQYLYLSLLPEALIFSMLSPAQFGKYMAIGDKKLSRSPALFFSVDPGVRVDGIDVERGRARCVEHADGTPRRSAYVSIHHVLERIPMEALGDLHLATRDGLVLTLQRSRYGESGGGTCHLYQEICPVSPRVVSSLGPKAFCEYVTSPDNPLYLPRLVFADLRLGELATDPDNADARDLPYPELKHLRSCLSALRETPGKKTKVVQRDFRPGNIFYLVEKGFYVGGQDDFFHYPMPAEDALLGEHNRWWNSATKTERY